MYQKENFLLEKKIGTQNLYFFNKEIIGWPDISETVHKPLCDFVTNQKTRKKLILLPRGHLKSSIVTVGYSLQLIAADPTVRILIANATYQMAVNFVGQIKKILMRNKKFRDMYGEMDKNADQWRQDMITVPAAESLREYEKKEPTVTAMGIDGNLTSAHYDVIILDDVVNRDNISTKDQIEKVILYYKDIIDLLEPTGKLIVIGTKWHDSDLYGWLMDPENQESEQVDVMLKQAITNPKIVREGKKYVLQGDEVVFPEKFNLKVLQELLDSKGPTEFASQYLNRILDDETATFRRNWIRKYEPDDLKGRVLNRYILVDPAISQEERADFTAMVVIGMDEFSKIWVLEIVRDKLTPIEIIDKLFLLDEKWKPKDIGIESVAFQKVLQFYIAEECKRRNHYLPMKEIRPETNESKAQRIMGLQPYYARGDVFHPAHTVNIAALEDELLRFPRGQHDDIIDALSYFPQLAFAPRMKREDSTRQHYLY